MTDTTLADASSTTIEDRLRRVQAVAGALFSIFVLLHLSNIALAPFGIEAFNAYQRVIRTFYQQPVIELIIVIGPLLAHVIAGIWLFVLRHGQPPKQRPLLARMHSWAGCFLLLVIFGHIAAVRGPSFFADVFPEFQGLAFSLWYLPYYFYPYYFLLALAGFYHATNGLRTLAARKGVVIGRSVQTNATIVAAIWVAVSLLSLGGVLVQVDNPADNDFARLLGGILGADPSVPIRIFGD